MFHARHVPSATASRSVFQVIRELPNDLLLQAVANYDALLASERFTNGGPMYRETVRGIARFTRNEVRRRGLVCSF